MSIAEKNRVSIVFGPEDCGLSNEELELCNDVVTIPTSQEAASINIAQAVMLICYEFFCLSEGRHGNSDPSNLAPAEKVEEMYDHMREVLMETGFLNPQNPELVPWIRRLSDALHRPVQQLPVTGECAGEGLAGQDAGQQTHSRARAGTVQRCPRVLQSILSTAVDGEGGCRLLLYDDPQGSDAGQRCPRVTAGEKTLDMAGSFSQCSKQKGPVRDRFVAGNADAATERARTTDAVTLAVAMHATPLARVREHRESVDFRAASPR